MKSIAYWVISVAILAQAGVTPSTLAAPMSEGEFLACVELAGGVYGAEDRMNILRAEIAALEQQITEASRRERRALTEELQVKRRELGEVTSIYMAGLPEVQAQCGNLEINRTIFENVCGQDVHRENRVCKSFGAMHTALWESQ